MSEVRVLFEHLSALGLKSHGLGSTPKRLDSIAFLLTRCLIWLRAPAVARYPKSPGTVLVTPAGRNAVQALARACYPRDLSQGFGSRPSTPTTTLRSLGHAFNTTRVWSMRRMVPRRCSTLRCLASLRFC